MPEIPDVSAIAEQVKARIKHIEEQLQQHQQLTGDLKRLRGALSRLEGAPRSRVGAGRRNRSPAATPTGSAARRARAANAPARAPRGQNKAKVLDALKNGPITASEIAKATGIGTGTGTVSTMLTKMAKSGELLHTSAADGDRLSRKAMALRRPARLLLAGDSANEPYCGGHYGRSRTNTPFGSTAGTRDLRIPQERASAGAT